jgi:COP9 signalosome complex subunit 6
MASHGAQPGQETNPLVSQAGSSELQVILHPLVLLTISDYISRHTLQGKTHPIVGGVLGQQNGREITIEHAFEVKMEEATSTVAEGWFAKRLEQSEIRARCSRADCATDSFW